MKMKLNRLTLENFKCHRHLEIRFDGRSASVYGKNGTGKSSVYDALTWLLFGKDSLGRTDFEILPLGRDGKVFNSEDISTVEAELDVDGVRRTLKRTYYEVWVTKRGSAEAVMNGHSSDFFVDGVPAKKKEFQAAVGELVDENRFRLLTSCSYFASALPWKDRRAVLFDICGTMRDEDIMASDVRFAPLTEALEGRGLEDYRKILSARRKELSGIQNDTPARLDECKKTVEELSTIDFDALERAQEEAIKRMDAIRQELDEALRDGGEAGVKSRITEVQNKLDRLENENTAHRLKQHRPANGSGFAGAKQDLEAARNGLELERSGISYLESRQEELKKEVLSCRDRWNAIQSEAFTGGVCPTCGQALPGDQLEEAKAAFEADKSRRKDQAVAQANRAKAEMEKVADRLNRAKERMSDFEARAKDAESRLTAAQNEPKPVVTDMEGYAENRARLLEEKKALLETLDRMRIDSTARTSEISRRLSEANAELRRLDGEAAKKSALEYAENRMEELRDQAAAAAEKLDRVDRMISLYEEFVRFKASFLEESVNSRFRFVKFRLFRELVNGGLEDCCDVTVDGVPYDGGLNNGARINAGIDIINTLSRHYGAWVPLFIDNAEGVSDLEAADTQTVELVVSRGDQKLRCELK